MLSSIQESFEKQMQEQGKAIRSRDYLGILNWAFTVEGYLFWNILYVSYAMYGTYDYETLIRIYIRFNTLSNKNIDIYFIYLDYFDKVKGTLSDEGFENLIKQIEKC